MNINMQQYAALLFEREFIAHDLDPPLINNSIFSLQHGGYAADEVENVKIDVKGYY
jgi:hypothetical protein